MNNDIDILFYDDLVLKENNLIIPHQCIHERLFVLYPLADIAPELEHPVYKKTIKALIESLEDKKRQEQEARKI